MKHISIVAALVLVAGCAAPPKAAVCRGEFRPVNQQRLAWELPTADTRLVLCPVDVPGERHG